MKQIGIVGAGAMGSGIAQVLAMAGYDVMVYDSVPASIIKARDAIDSSLTKLASKYVITDPESKAIFSRLFFIDQFNSLGSCDLILEAIVENETAKTELFARLKDIIHPNTILASKTSSLSITSMAAHAAHPGRFIGIHFFNPPVLMKLVEIIPALQTDASTIEAVMQLITSCGKTPVLAKDTPGFIVNRIARPFYSEAIRIVEEQLATPADIDHAMKTHGGFRMGPFELMDFIGHDVNYAVTTSVWTAMYYDDRYTPSHLQANLVRAGWLGRKSGRGFYQYRDGINTETEASDKNQRQHFDRILVMLINEAADALYKGIASRDDIEKAMTLGVNYPKGLLAWADQIGIAGCVAQLDALFDTYHEPRYRCSPLLRRMAQQHKTFFP